MTLKRKRRKQHRFRVGLFVLSLPLIWFAQWHLRGQLVEPQVALVLGGAPERERFAAKFALTHPEVDIWVSSGANPEYAEWVFETAHIAPERVRLDYQAVDTVTNFTTLVDDLQQQGIHSIYLITSDYHMRRAKVIAQIILGSRGIYFKPVVVPSDRDSETLVRSIRDGARSVLWVCTGKTGSEFIHFSKKMSSLRHN